MTRFIALAAALGLAACQTAPAPVLSLAEQATAAKTPAVLKKAGARKLTEADIRAELMDRSLRAGDRVWTISSDGSFVSRANDGTNTMGGSWMMLGDRFCTRADRCGTLHELGGIYRFADSATTLAPWTIRPN